MKPIRSVAFCLMILGVGIPAAADTKSVHGAVCQATQVFSGGSVTYGGDNGISVSGGAYVVCPLMRDRINSSSSLSSAVAEVWISSSSGSILCNFYSQGEDSGAGSYVDVDTVERYTSGEGQMTFSVSSSNGNEGTYGMFCDISNATIRHIHTNESDSATD
jgi:hypothetical protein